jgi:hypothetical protein
MNLRCSNSNFFVDSLIEIQFDNYEKLETFIGAFKRNDLIRPLEIEITLEKNDMLKIESFQHFKK